MDIRQLRYFNTIAHLENLSKAADYLHISQSALTKHIQRLENEIGSPLFDRRGKKIVLNNAGKRFHAFSELMLREMQSVRDDIDMITFRKANRIRIGSCGLPKGLPECLAAFSAVHPEASFILNNRVEFDEQIDINQYDALICPDEFRFESLNGCFLYEETYLFAVSRNERPSFGAVFHVSSLKDMPLVFLQGDSQLPEHPCRVCEANNIEPGTLYFCDTRETHRRMIAAGCAAGFVPESEAESYRHDPAIQLLPVLDSRFNRSMKICFRREKHLSELGLSFRDHVMEYYHLTSAQNTSPKGGTNP